MLEDPHVHGILVYVTAAMLLLVIAMVVGGGEE